MPSTTNKYVLRVAKTFIHICCTCTCTSLFDSAFHFNCVYIFLVAASVQKKKIFQFNLWHMATFSRVIVAFECFLNCSMYVFSFIFLVCKKTRFSLWQTYKIEYTFIIYGSSNAGHISLCRTTFYTRFTCYPESLL